MPGGDRPAAVLVMAEHGVVDPVWDRPGGAGEPLDLALLGVPDALVRSLRRWNQRYRDLASTGYEWPEAAVQAVWTAEGRRLAFELQNVLPDVEVRYHEDGDVRPVRERRGS